MLNKEKIKMSGIQRLDDEVINKIAAGEVVERPASVVKELVENAIDANATQIIVDIEEGGQTSIVVRDNGVGLKESDYALAITRHATSKISQVDDLFQISTMGFRGEALASIASISRFSLRSRHQQESSGFKCEKKEGEELVVSPWNGSQGTMVSVRDLFYNVPVRAKFLKSVSTEYAYCLELIQSFSLARPDIGFTLNHNKKEKFYTVGLDVSRSLSDEKGYFGEGCLRKKIASVYGIEKDTDYLYVRDCNDYATFEGLISAPGVEKATSKSMVFFVNGRFVRDKVMRYSVLRGFHSHLLKGRYPFAVCFLKMDPSLVDVNVHPAKTEVRFQYTQSIQELIGRSIRERLRKGDWAQCTLTNHSVLSVDGSVSHPQSLILNKPKNQLTTYLQSGTKKTSFSLKPQTKVSPTIKSYYNGIDPSSEANNMLSSPVEEPSEGTQKEEDQAFMWGELRFIGSFMKCYLFFEYRSQLLAVDQHAFHERILYEKLITDRHLRATSQPLMIPECINLDPTKLIILWDRKKEVVHWGFDFVKLNDREIELRAVPSILIGKDFSSLFSSFADDLKKPSAKEVLSGLVSTIACHSAVRAGEDLPESDLQVLIDQAASIDFYHNCPHGRRVFKWIEKKQVEKWFDRL